MLPEDIEENIERLFDYFNLHKDEWPYITIYTSDGPQVGVVDDELFNILLEMYESYYNIKEEDNDFS